MTTEELNEAVNGMMENFRAFIVEELQRHYNAGRTVSSDEVRYLLKLFEDNEMVKMFNEDRIPQDKFRVFLQKYLRLWFEMLAEKIAEAGGKTVEAGSLADLPTDGSALVAAVGGELYFWDGGKWKKACDCVPGKIPSFDSPEDLPDSGGVNIAAADGELYYRDGGEWTKVLTESELGEAISGVFGDIANYINDVLGGNSFKDKGKTYHDAVLQIVDAIPDMADGDRYLLNIVEQAGSPPVVTEEIEALQNAMFSKPIPRSIGDGLFLGGGTVLDGSYILHNNLAKSTGMRMYNFVEFNGTVYGLGQPPDVNETVPFGLYRFNAQSGEYEEILIDGRPAGIIARWLNDRRLFPFDDKLWFNSPAEDGRPRWSHIDESGQVFPGTPLDGSVENLGSGAAVFDGRLYIGSNSGLWVQNTGDTVPQHINSALFDSGDVVPQTVFDGKLWLSVGGRPVSYDGAATTEYSGIESAKHFAVWNGELYLSDSNTGDVDRIYRLQGNSFEVAFPNLVSYGDNIYGLAVWNDMLWVTALSKLCTIDALGNLTVRHSGVSAVRVLDDGSLLVEKISTGRIAVERHSLKTTGGGSGSTAEIKIVGMNGDGQYDEPFGEGHRVVVKDSPTGFSREYGMRDGELIDTDGSDNAAIRGNVDTYADLSTVNMGDIRVGDGMIVEQDENHDNNSAIYTWDGADWNFTHLWEISLELRYGTYSVPSGPFAFSKFAAKNENSEEFDVLEVSFAGNCDLSVAAASGKSGDTRIMIFNVAAGQTVNLSFGFAYKLVDGGELSLAQGTHVATLLRASVPIINIAPYSGS